MMYVNDIELIDSNGKSLDESVKNYLSGKVNISRSDHHLTTGLPVYAIDFPEDQLHEELKSYGYTDLFFGYGAKLGMLVAYRIAARNNIPKNTAVIAVTLDGSQHSKIEAIEAFWAGKKRVSAKVAATCTASSICTNISRNLQLTGNSVMLNQACSAFIGGLDYAKKLLDQGTVENVLLVGTETSSHPFNLFIFNSLGVYTKDQLMPFDKKRSGMALGDAAVCWLLSNKPTDNAYAKIDKVSVYNDSYHLTSHNPDSSAVEHLIKELVTDQVDSVNCHGTGTTVGDQIEINGLNKFLNTPTPVYALKSQVGHCMASSAGVEMSYGIAGMQQDWIPYTPLTTDTIESRHHIVVGKPLYQKNNNFLKLSFGFGGTSGGVLVEKARP
jgi:3-oxoacyl-(acyl-carrier-protein) synthase